MTEPIEHVEYHEHHQSHPAPRAYTTVAILLAIVTAVEVGIYYLDMSPWILVTVLMVLALVKFSFVARWFMHLKFDEHIFRMLFITGLITALIVFGVVLTVFLSRGGPSPIVTGG